MADMAEEVVARTAEDKVGNLDKAEKTEAAVACATVAVPDLASFCAVLAVSR